MEKHYELKDDKLMFLLKLWCREHNRELNGMKIVPFEDEKKDPIGLGVKGYI